MKMPIREAYQGTKWSIVLPSIGPIATANIPISPNSPITKLNHKLSDYLLLKDRAYVE